MKHSITIRRGAEGETIQLPGGDVLPLDRDMKQFVTRAYSQFSGKPMTNRRDRKQQQRRQQKGA
jgi:hypothetical protein